MHDDYNLNIRVTSPCFSFRGEILGGPLGVCMLTLEPYIQNNKVGKRESKAGLNTYTLVLCWLHGPCVELRLCDVLHLSLLLSLGFPSLPLRSPPGWTPSAQTRLFSSQPFPKSPEEKKEDIWMELHNSVWWWTTLHSVVRIKTY